MTDYLLNTKNLKVFKSNNDVLLTNMLNRNRNINAINNDSVEKTLVYIIYLRLKKLLLNKLTFFFVFFVFREVSFFTFIFF